MNKWVKESFNLAGSKGYLDDLSTTYPISVNAVRKLTVPERERVAAAFKTKDGALLVKTLLGFKRFPIDDPYIGFLRKDSGALERNPRTLERISKHLFELGLEGIVDGIQRPISPSKQFGQLFRSYTKKLGFKVIQSEDEFINAKGIAIFDGGDANLKRVAKKYFGYKGKKGLDLIMKINGQVFLGEAKFISTNGGTQDKSFRETMNFVKRGSGGAKHMAIIDGVVWAQNGSSRTNLYGQLHRLPEGKFVMSALLLKKFITSL